MDARITILAANLLLASVILVLVGYFTGSYSVVGAAASIGTVAAALLTIGLSYREPSINLMVKYCEVSRTVLAKLAEDMGLTSHTLYAIPEGKAVTIVVSKPNITLENPKPLIGIGEAPYVAFKVRFEGGEAGEVGENTIDAFKAKMTDTYGVSRNVEVKVEGEECNVVFEDINETVKPLIRKPLSPVTVVALAELAKALGRKLQLVHERAEDNTLELKVVLV